MLALDLATRLAVLLIAGVSSVALKHIRCRALWAASPALLASNTIGARACRAVAAPCAAPHRCPGAPLRFLGSRRCQHSALGTRQSKRESSAAAVNVCGQRCRLAAVYRSRLDLPVCSGGSDVCAGGERRVLVSSLAGRGHYRWMIWWIFSNCMRTVNVTSNILPVADIFGRLLENSLSSLR